MEIVFSVNQEIDGGFVAECLSPDIFTEGDSWDELRANVQEAVNAFFYDSLTIESQFPTIIQYASGR